MISFQPSLRFNKQAAVIFCDSEQVKTQKITGLSSGLKDELKSAYQNKIFQGGNGEVFSLTQKGKSIVFAGLGKRENISATQLRTAVRAALLSSLLRKVSSVEIFPYDQKDTTVIGMIEGILIGTYQWTKYLASKKDEVKKSYILISEKKTIYTQAITTCEGVNVARDLINENADVANSVFMESVIRKIIKGAKNFSIKVLNKKDLKAKGLGLILSVNQGSKQDPKLIIVEYKGSSKKSGHTALVGKGVTYDTGGLNLKPSGFMETMKMDMGGAAAVIGTLKNTVALKPKKNILFVVGLVENAIGPDAYKPGDVISGYAKKSIEVGNTDAEGRLVLADAISYVVKNYKPARLIDLATLTGACVIALGHDYTGMVSTDDKLANQLLESARLTDDRIWRMPTYPEIKDAVKSEIADIKNVGWPRGAGGMITAAEFLRQFTEGTKWAHLDIAGTAFVDGKSRWYFAHGGTGAGVRALTNFLQNN